MNIILLSGGSGKRLWPLSNDRISKQFIKLLKTSNGYESMLQRVYRLIKSAEPTASVTVATSCTQVSFVRGQLGENVSISAEPVRRDTFPAVVLAAAFLHDRQGVPEKDACVVCPVDSYADERFFTYLRKLYDRAEKGDKNLVLMGIRPDCPDEKYGYLTPVQHADETAGYSFAEKPAAEKAAEYIAQGALWNSGIFAFRLKYVLDRGRELLGTADYSELLTNYACFERISFDYAVAEQETSLEVLEYDGRWTDLGTWDALAEIIDEKTLGDILLNENQGTAAKMT